MLWPGENSWANQHWANGYTKKADRFPHPLFEFRLPIKALALAELERLAGALATVFFSFLHAAIPGEKARIAKAPSHGIGGIFHNRFGPFGGRNGRIGTGQTIHFFDCPGKALTHCTGLAGTTTTLNIGYYINPASKVGDQKGPLNKIAILVFMKIGDKILTVDFDLASSFENADAGNRGLATAGAPIKLGFGYSGSHGQSLLDLSLGGKGTGLLSLVRMGGTGK